MMRKVLKTLAQFLLALLLVQVLAVLGVCMTGFIEGLHDIPYREHVLDHDAVWSAFAIVAWTALCIGAALGKKWEWLP